MQMHTGNVLGGMAESDPLRDGLRYFLGIDRMEVGRGVIGYGG